MDDSSIVELYLCRNEDAVRQSAEKYGSRLRKLSYGIVCDHATVEECENDTYLQAWNAIPPHEPKTYLYAFLARITRHLSLNACRSRGRLKRSAFLCELSDELEACIAAPDDAACRMTDEDLRDILNAFLSSLPEKSGMYFCAGTGFLIPSRTSPSTLDCQKAA